MDPNQQDVTPKEPSQSTVEPTTATFASPQAATELQQPEFQPPTHQAPFGQPVAAPVPAENPGQTLGIISLVLNFVGFAFVGMILGIISRKKSKAAGASTTLGTIGMVTGIVFTVLGALFFILIILTTYAGLQQAAKEAQIKSSGSPSTSVGSENKTTLSSDALTVAKHAEAYNAVSGDYPKYISDFSEFPESTLPDDIYVYGGRILLHTTLTYIYCGEGSAQIAYLGDTKDGKEITKITALGTASSTEVCAKSF